MLEASRALELGLLNRLVPEGGALETALELGGHIAANAPLALSGAKRVVGESRDWPLDEAFARLRPIYEPIRASEDAKEGARAFAEKRSPVWRGL